MNLSDSQVLRPERQAASQPRRGSLPRSADGPTCLLTTLHPERALSRALIEHLAQEMPDISFTLRSSDQVSAVWICGYEPGATQMVALQRAQHPHAMLLVTGRGQAELWRDEVLAAGADRACSWPLPYAELARLLHERRSEPLA